MLFGNSCGLFSDYTAGAGVRPRLAGKPDWLGHRRDR